jgi:hypothetical protein
MTSTRTQTIRIPFILSTSQREAIVEAAERTGAEHPEPHLMIAVFMEKTGEEEDIVAAVKHYRTVLRLATARGDAEEYVTYAHAGLGRCAFLLKKRPGEIDGHFRRAARYEAGPSAAKVAALRDWWDATGRTSLAVGYIDAAVEWAKAAPTDEPWKPLACALTVADAWQKQYPHAAGLLASWLVGAFRNGGWTWEEPRARQVADAYAGRLDILCASAGLEDAVYIISILAGYLEPDEEVEG